MYTKNLSILTLLSVFLFTACKNDTPQLADLKIDDVFQESLLDWTVDFADYPVGQETNYKLGYGYEKLPAPLDRTAGAIKITGSNHSDDLFMFMKRKVSGLVPNKVYQMDLEVTFASNVPNGIPGAGGSPGEGVYVKAGIMPTEPMKVKAPARPDHYIMNIDKGNQAQSGKDMQVIGHVANGTNKAEYTLVKRSGSFTGTTNQKGEIWICIGTDSGFEAITTLYYTQVKARLY